MSKKTAEKSEDFDLESLESKKWHISIYDMIYNYTACIIKSPSVNESCKWIDSDLCWSFHLCKGAHLLFSKKTNRAFSNFLHSFGVVKQWDSVSLLRRPLCRSDQSSWWFCVHACNECVQVLKGGSPDPVITGFITLITRVIRTVSHL